MEEQQFRAVIDEFLAPMLQAEVSEARHEATRRQQQVAYGAPTQILLRPLQDSPYRVAIERRQEFLGPERALVEDFVVELATIVEQAEAPYFPDLLRALPRRIVSRHLGGGDIVALALEQLEDWSAQTYEGQRIVAALGFRPEAEQHGLALAELWGEPFGPVLSNGFDTMIEVSRDGFVLDLLQLPDTPAPERAPHRLGRIAAWANEGCLAAVLNRHGEVLLFGGGELRFARRNGSWQHYVHGANIRKMMPRVTDEVRRAVYASALDVSYSRTGGCIGLIKGPHIRDVRDMVADHDLLEPPDSYKARVLNRVIVGRQFHNLDRRLRAELLSLDGALLMDTSGSVMAVGAIVQVPGGAVDGGGRTAAAHALSQYGMGIKVSEDGGMSGYIDQVLQVSV